MADNSHTSRQKPGKKSIVFLCILTILVVIYELYVCFGQGVVSNSMQQHTTVHFIDVGQGDCSLIVSGGEAVLMDAGLTATADQVIDYLREAGVTRLTAAVGTHPHEDHIGGMAAVLEAFPTDVLYLPAQTALTATYTSMLDAAEQTGVSVQVPSPGQVLTFGNQAALTFLAPTPDDTFDNANNYSIISMLAADDFRVLFTGDAEAQAEEAVLASGADLSCDVLKVGHHGSDTSSTNAFLDAVSPKIAVISCAKYNDYGHPHPETLARLAEHNVTVYVTADSGTFRYPTPVNQKGDNAT